MTGAKVHHVVFCVRAENLERAADLWRDVGMTFGGIVVDEADLTPVLGMSITLLATNLGE